ncbi:MAG: glycosyltransferase family 39 protein, partial [Candidatus Pacearchaeota archaeon]|nr:glycosyltransferase family 39 protein [Candidatus Pacearchaeota archaeon]
MKKRTKESEKKKGDGKKELLFIIIILAICFLLRLFLTTCYYWDELVYLQHAEIISGKVDNYNEFDFRPPLLPLLIAGLYLVWHNPIIANVFVSLLASFTILFVYLAAKEMFGRKTAVIAALLLTFWQIHIYFSKTLLVHTTAMFFASVFLVLLKRAENDKNKKNFLMFFLAGAFAGMAILTRFTYLSLVPIILINIFLLRKKYNLKRLFCGLLGLLIVLLPYLIWAYSGYEDPFYTFKMASLMTSWSTQQPWYFYFTNFWPFLSWSGVFGLVFWLFFKIKDKKISREEIFLLAWLLLPLIYLSFMSHKEVRFLLILLIPISMLSAIGFEKCSGKIKNNKIFILLFFLVLAISFFTFSYNPYPRICETDAQKASEWIMENTNVDEVIYANHEFTALAYYTARR